MSNFFQKSDNYLNFIIYKKFIGHVVDCYRLSQLIKTNKIKILSSINKKKKNDLNHLLKMIYFI